MSRPGDVDEADPHYSREEPLHESHTISANELRALYEERVALKAKVRELEAERDEALTEWNKKFREAASTEANMFLLSANKRLTIENSSLKEHNARLEKACDIFEKNSADACDLAEALQAMIRHYGRDDDYAREALKRAHEVLGAK